MTGGRFERCLRFTLVEEGGYSNVTADKGGATNRGVTAATFTEAKRLGLVKASTVHDLTVEDVERVYWSLYWLPSHAQELPAPLDLCLFDAYVNHRPQVAVRLIQAGVGVEQDGIFGPKTVDGAHLVQAVTAIERYCYERERFYRQIVKNDPTQERFLRGWLNRVAHVKSAALAEVA